MDIRLANRNMSDQVFTSKKAIQVTLVGIILLQALFCIHYGIMKKGFFVDELWGAGLANSYFHPSVCVPNVFNTNTYFPGSYFYNYLTVVPDEGFSIASVWFNQSMDSHPPLYFLLYHTLSCFKPGSFSKWTGIIINLFFFICSDIYIFLTAKKITGYPLAGLAAVALWGFSAEAVSYTLCARMYMMAAFFVILFVYTSLLFYEPTEKPGWRNSLLILATTGGCLTHYYFYIAAFIMAALTCFYLNIKDGFSKACKYGFYVLGGVFLSWAIYPQIFHSLRHGDGRGREAIRNLKDIGSLWERIGKLIAQIEEKLLYKPILVGVILLSTLIVLTIILSIRWRNRVDSSLKSRLHMLLATQLTFGFYLLAVAKLQPFYTNRYYFPITTLLWIVVLGNVILFIQVLLKCSTGSGIRERMIVLPIILALAATAGIGTLKSHLDHKVMFLYPRQEKILAQIQQMDRPSALFVEHERVYTLAVHCLELANCSEALCINVSSEDELGEYDIHDENDSCLVIAAQDLDQNKILNQILNKTSYRSYELIGRGSGIWWEDVEECYIYAFSKKSRIK